MIFLQCFSYLIYLILVAGLHLQTQLAGCYPLGIIVTLVTHTDNVTTQTGNNLTHANQLSGRIIQFYHERIGSATLEETITSIDGMLGDINSTVGGVQSISQGADQCGEDQPPQILQFAAGRPPSRYFWQTS